MKHATAAESVDSTRVSSKFGNLPEGRVREGETLLRFVVGGGGATSRNGIDSQYVALHRAPGALGGQRSDGNSSPRGNHAKNSGASITVQHPCDPREATPAKLGAKRDPATGYLASTHPKAMWRSQTSMDRMEDVLEWDFSEIARGVNTFEGERLEHPLILVCTNGRRDACCALRGRPLAGELAARHPEKVWECSHIGGHRFSPTVLVLPSGYCYGQVGAEHCDQIISSATSGKILIESNRGRSTWNNPAQAAELYLRRETGECDLNSITVENQELSERGKWRVTVRHTDGRLWRVAVDERPLSRKVPVGCGKDPDNPTVMHPRSYVLQKGPNPRADLA